MSSAYSPLHLSTASIPERDRLPMWREVFGQKMCWLDIEAIGDTPFYAEGTLGALSDANYACVAASPVRFTRTRQLIAADADPVERLYLIIADTPVAVSQGGRDHVLSTGDAIFLRGGEFNRIDCYRPNHLTNISVALDELRLLYPGVDDLAMRVVPRQSDLLGLLQGYVDMLRLRTHVASNTVTALAAGHIRDLFGAIAAAGASGETVAEYPGVGAARLRAIKADIVAHLYDPGLDIEGVAARMGIGARYIRRLFQGEGSSFSAYVLNERLVRAYQQLSQPGSAQRTIAEIAYACGFGDLSYFNRSFRRRFGMAPSDARSVGRYA